MHRVRLNTPINRLEFEVHFRPEILNSITKCDEICQEGSVTYFVTLFLLSDKLMQLKPVVMQALKRNE